ncbi:hypothetical protein [Micromonospora sp. AKA38]|uniref:hypothetical protein n=1 Tax=Micromonospora sp. AKA38 TaxID=2733861 RepID=UPI0022BCA630|nr:hypothetical protein [Micromonospora sp. AKA38]GHJ17844.1 hypothetical protein TPA0908_58390 [Micromonospora sp. AKA38]
MLPVAFASSAWTAMLRRIARTAVTTLALIAGLQGIATTSADAATVTRPAVVTVTDTRVSSTVDAGREATSTTSVAEPGTAAAWAVTHSATGPSVADRFDDASVAPIPAVEVPVTDDAGRATIARRGPPRA